MDLPANSTLFDITDTLATWNHKFCRHPVYFILKGIRKFFFIQMTQILGWSLFFEEYKKLKVGQIFTTRVYKHVVARKLMFNNRTNNQQLHMDMYQHIQRNPNHIITASIFLFKGRNQIRMKVKFRSITLPCGLSFEERLENIARRDCIHNFVGSSRP